MNFRSEEVILFLFWENLLDIRSELGSRKLTHLNHIWNLLTLWIECYGWISESQNLSSACQLYIYSNMKEAIEAKHLTLDTCTLLWWKTYSCWAGCWYRHKHIFETCSKQLRPHFLMSGLWTHHTLLQISNHISTGCPRATPVGKALQELLQITKVNPSS